MIRCLLCNLLEAKSLWNVWGFIDELAVWSFHFRNIAPGGKRWSYIKKKKKKAFKAFSPKYFFPTFFPPFSSSMTNSWAWNRLTFIFLGLTQWHKLRPLSNQGKVNQQSLGASEQEKENQDFNDLCLIRTIFLSCCTFRQWTCFQISEIVGV